VWPKGELSVEGEVERVTFESPTSGFRVIKLRVSSRDARLNDARLTVTGTFPKVGAGARVRVRGTIELDRKHGEQLRAQSVTELAPSTLEGIRRYLGSGLIKGVGETYAARIVDAFGLDTLRVLDEAPERLREVEGLGEKRIESIVQAWSEQRAVRDVMVFLQAHDVSPSLATRIYKRYGARAVDVVSRNPYRLALDVHGIGFRTADRIASSLGIGQDAPERIEAGVLQALHERTEAGHVYAPADELFVHAARTLEPEAPERVEVTALGGALERLALEDHVRLERLAPFRRVERVERVESGREANADCAVYLRAMHDAERRVAERIAELARSAPPRLADADVDEAIAAFEKAASATLAPEQRHAVAFAASAPIVIVTGGPGVGKTTVVRALLALFERARLDVRLAAPTGRAAKRITETTGREASTLHRLLEFDPKGGRFKRDKQVPLDATAIIVDEASMIDLPMADALLQAVPLGARLVFVGDVDQLPSVGPGSVLRDLIASERVATARLRTIFRQAAQSLIVTNAHRINAGDPPEAPPQGATDADFFVIERREPEAAKATIVELVTSRIPKRFGFDPVRDVQVLSPMHRGPAGTVALNDALQLALNPRGDQVRRAGRTFRVGDKVMQLRNDYDRNVWNGDVGVVLRIEPEEASVVVGFDERAREASGASSYEREVAYDAAALDDLTLAYACSIHKSQGSEYPAVVIPFLTTHFVMLSRNLLYTAVTRGKKLVVLVTDPRALSLALGSARREERKTRLAARLAEALDPTVVRIGGTDEALC
jgi:exodeoxyribonuclease V alpha subunit